VLGDSSPPLDLATPDPAKPALGIFELAMFVRKTIARVSIDLKSIDLKTPGLPSSARPLAQALAA